MRRSEEREAFYNREEETMEERCRGIGKKKEDRREPSKIHQEIREKLEQLQIKGLVQTNIRLSVGRHTSRTYTYGQREGQMPIHTDILC